MYYIVMYGAVLLGIIALLVGGIGMVIKPADKVKLKPGQDRDTAVRSTRNQGKVCIVLGVAIIFLIIVAVNLIGVEYIPGIGY